MHNTNWRGLNPRWTGNGSGPGMFSIYWKRMIQKTELITTEMAQKNNMYGILVPLAGRDSDS